MTMPDHVESHVNELTSLANLSPNAFERALVKLSPARLRTSIRTVLNHLSSTSNAGVGEESDPTQDWPISSDGPHTITDQRRWLARKLLDSKLSDQVAIGIVAHSPDISDRRDAIIKTANARAESAEAAKAQAEEDADILAVRVARLHGEIETLTAQRDRLVEAAKQAAGKLRLRASRVQPRDLGTVPWLPVDIQHDLDLADALNEASDHGE